MFGNFQDLCAGLGEATALATRAAEELQSGVESQHRRQRGLAESAEAALQSFKSAASKGSAAWDSSLQQQGLHAKELYDQVLARVRKIPRPAFGSASNGAAFETAWPPAFRLRSAAKQPVR